MPPIVTAMTKRCCRCLSDIPPNGIAYLQDAAARGTNVMSGIFLSSALLSLASSSVLGGPADPPVTFFGIPMKASSLLAMMGAVGGLGGALLMPLVGAIVDHTPHRRLLGRLSASLLLVVSFAQAFASEKSGAWQWVAYLQVFSGWIYSTHSVCIYAYLPEMDGETAPASEEEALRMLPLDHVAGRKSSAVVAAAAADDDDEDFVEKPPARQAAGTRKSGGKAGDDYAEDGGARPLAAAGATKTAASSLVTLVTSRETMVQFGSQFSFLVFVIIISLGFSKSLPKDFDSLDEVNKSYVEKKTTLSNNLSTCRASQITTFLVATYFYTLCWKRLPSRPALHPLPPSTPCPRYVTVGVSKLLSTCLALSSKYRETAFFLAAVTVSKAANTCFSTLAVTYTVSVLGMTASESGLLFAVVLIFAVPGALVYDRYVTSKYGPMKSCMLATGLWGVVTTVAPFFMQNPKQKANAYVFGAIWGALYGAYAPPLASVYVSMIPRGQESEMMGVYIFAGQLLVWLPPVIFSGMNEAGINMAWGLVQLGLFFFASLGIMFFFVFPNYDAAVLKARKEDKVAPVVVDAAAGVEMTPSVSGEVRTGGNKLDVDRSNFV